MCTLNNSNQYMYVMYWNMFHKVLFLEQKYRYYRYYQNKHLSSDVVKCHLTTNVIFMVIRIKIWNQITKCHIFWLMVSRTANPTVLVTSAFAKFHLNANFPNSTFGCPPTRIHSSRIVWRPWRVTLCWHFSLVPTKAHMQFEFLWWNQLSALGYWINVKE